MHLGKETRINQSTKGWLNKGICLSGILEEARGSEHLILAGVGLSYPGPVCACQHCTGKEDRNLGCSVLLEAVG